MDSHINAYDRLIADHRAINGPRAPLAYGVGNDMSYAMYTDNGHELSFWTKGLPSCGGAPDTELRVYGYRG